MMFISRPESLLQCSNSGCVSSILGVKCLLCCIPRFARVYRQKGRARLEPEASLSARVFMKVILFPWHIEILTCGCKPEYAECFPCQGKQSERGVPKDDSAQLRSSLPRTWHVIRQKNGIGSLEVSGLYSERSEARSQAQKVWYLSEPAENSGLMSTPIQCESHAVSLERSRARFQ